MQPMHMAHRIPCPELQKQGLTWPRDLTKSLATACWGLKKYHSMSWKDVSKHCQGDVSISRPIENRIDLSLLYAINLCKYVLMTTSLAIHFLRSSSHTKPRADTIHKSTSLVTRPLQPGRKMQGAGDSDTMEMTAVLPLSAGGFWKVLLSYLLMLWETSHGHRSPCCCC